MSDQAFNRFIEDCRQRERSKPPMMLLTQANRKALPELYANDGKGEDAHAIVKFFCPWNNWTWYATEFDGVDSFFGLVVGQETELGYFSLSEMAAVRGPAGLEIERDRSFKSCKLSECRAKHP